MCVYLVFIMLWGPMAPTKIVIPVHFELVGTFVGPHEETSLYITQNEVYWKSEIAESFLWGVGLGLKLV